MRRIVLVFALLISTLSVFAGKGEMSIKGTITNPTDEQLRFNYINYDGNWLNYEENSITADLDAKGNFSISLPLSQQYSIIVIRHGKVATEVYGSPGDKLKMTADGNEFVSSVQYEGSGSAAELANFMAKHVVERGLSRGYLIGGNEAYVKEQQAYLATIDANVQSELDFLIEHGMGLPQSFVEFWNAQYEYLKYENILSYPHMHEIKKQGKYDIGKVPQENYRVINRVPEKYNDKWLYIWAYRMYVDNYYEQKLNAEDVQNTTPYFFADKKLELAHQHMPSGTEEYVFAEHIYSHIKYSPMVRTEELYETFSKRYRSSDYADFLVEKINLKKRLAPGSPVVDFTVMTEDGKKVKVSDLKGKVVYIDFWASWCGPCKMQFPYTKKLKRHFKGKDVAFVYVSIDKDEKAWKEAIKKYDLEGYHTRVDDKKSDVTKDYGIRGVPTYFLVDREGNFATEVTPRPSQGDKLINAIEALL